MKSGQNTNGQTMGEFMNVFTQQERGAKKGERLMRETKEVHRQLPCRETVQLDAFDWVLVDQLDKAYVKGSFKFSGHHYNGPPIEIRDYRRETVELFHNQAESLKQLNVYLDLDRINKEVAAAKEEQRELQQQIDYLDDLTNVMLTIKHKTVSEVEIEYLKIESILKQNRELKNNKGPSNLERAFENIAGNFKNIVDGKPANTDALSDLSSVLVLHMERLNDQVIKLIEELIELRNRKEHVTGKIKIEKKRMSQVEQDLSSVLGKPCLAADVTLRKDSGVGKPRVSKFMELADLPPDLPQGQINGVVRFTTARDHFPKPIPIEVAMLSGISSTSVTLRELFFGLRSGESPDEIVKSTTYHSRTFRHQGEAILRADVPDSKHMSRSEDDGT